MNRESKNWWIVQVCFRVTKVGDWLGCWNQVNRSPSQRLFYDRAEQFSVLWTKKFQCTFTLYSDRLPRLMRVTKNSDTQKVDVLFTSGFDTLISGQWLDMSANFLIFPVYNLYSFFLLHLMIYSIYCLLYRICRTPLRGWRGWMWKWSMSTRI